MELWDFVCALAYEPVVIGKGKNNPLNPAATPGTVRDSAADKVRLSAVFTEWPPLWTRT